jgi:hypothetical protein
MYRKNINLALKYPVFANQKRNVFLHTAKCLKAKKSYYVFHTPKNNVLACILALITSLLKVKRTLTKISKTTKILFCLSFSIRSTTLDVIHIPDIKFFFFGR